MWHNVISKLGDVKSIVRFPLFRKPFPLQSPLQRLFSTLCS